MAEEEHVAGGDAVADAGLPHLRVQLVGHEHHHDVALAGGIGGLDDAEPVLLGLGDGRRVGTETDDDRHAGVMKVQRMRVALRAVTDDRDGLAVELVEICVVVVEHRSRRLHGDGGE